MSTNEDGQPLNRSFNAARLNDRKIDELIGICKGVVFDGVIVTDEASSMLSWLDRNSDIKECYPANILYSNLSEMLKDNTLDSDEEKHLLSILVDITGEPVTNPFVESMSSTLPLCSPEPKIIFESNKFCATGKFVFGTRNKVAEKIISLGGLIKPNLTQDVNYLVIGSVGSSDWIHSSFGRKIEKAVNLRADGVPIHIISEKYFLSSPEINLSIQT